MSELERWLVERAGDIVSNPIPTAPFVTARRLREAAAALGECREALEAILVDAEVYGSKEWVWPTREVYERGKAALARLSPGAAGEGGDRGR